MRPVPSRGGAPQQRHTPTSFVTPTGVATTTFLP